MNFSLKIFYPVFFSLLFLKVGGFAFGYVENILLVRTLPVSGSLKTGEKQSYLLDAKEHEVIEIGCEKKDIDLNLAVFAPDGKNILISNAPDGFSGKETLLFPAEKSGKYRIEITSRRPGNHAGSYTILFKDERTPNESDAARADGMRLAGEAREVMRGAENRVEKASKAIEKLERAAALFEKSGDLQSQSNALFYRSFLIGNEYGKNKDSAQAYEKVLKIQTEIGDDAGKAITLANAGNEERDSGNTEKSQAYFDEALRLNQKLNSAQDRATTLSFLCRLYNDTGNFQKGFDACRESLQIDNNADPIINHRTYSILAVLYGNTGNHDESLKNYQISLEHVLPITDYLNPIRLATVRGNIAGVYYEKWDYKKAESFYLEAYQVSETVKRPIYSAFYLTQLSYVALEVKEYKKALGYAEKSLALYRENDPRKRQDALNAVGRSALALGETGKARAAFSEALTMNRQNKDRYAEAETLYNLAKLEKDEGNPETARLNIEQSIHLSEIIRADLLGKNQRSSYLSILKRFYEFKIDTLLKLDEKNGDSQFLEQAWQTQEKNRARSLLENFLESGFDSNEVLPPDFFAREKTLLETITAAEVSRAEAAKSKNPAALKKAEGVLQKSLDDYETLREEMRRVNPQFSAINAPKEISFADAQKLLDGETAFLEYSLGEKQSCVWLIGKNFVKVFRLPARTEINRISQDLYLALTDRTAKNDNLIREKSALLNQKILQPLAKEIAGFQRLVIIPDESLQLVPFAVLLPSADLKTSREFVVEPSISNLVYLRENKLKRLSASGKLLAVFADPVFQADDERLGKNLKNGGKIVSGGAADKADALKQTLSEFGIDKLSRLPFTGIEARGIAGIEPDKTILATGVNASRRNFLQGSYNSYKILHFATHGFLNPENPDLSGLVLSLYDENRRPQNGFLRVIDLYSLKLNADLVVLSACQTGLGKDMAGEGIIGLTQGFIYAGATTVVSSLWKVDDAATAELMKRFYRSMLKDNQPPAAALKIAQNELRQTVRFGNPQNWSGFILTGEWQ